MEYEDERLQLFNGKTYISQEPIDIRIWSALF